MLTTKKWRFAIAVEVTTIRRGIAGSLGALLAVLVLTGCSPPGRRNLLQGERLIRQGRPAEAIRPLQEAVTLLATNAPACAQAWNFLGLAYHYANQPAGAAQAYQNALAHDFNLVVVRFNRGCLFLEQNNLPAAINELTTYTTHQPKDALGWTKLGAAQMRSRQVEPAEASFRRALDLSPRPALAAEILNNLGLCSVLRRRPDDALKYFNAALRQQTNHPPALLNQAIIAHQQNNDLPLALDRYRAYLDTPSSRPHAAAVSNLASQIDTELRLRAAATSVVPTLVLVTNLRPQPTNALLTARPPAEPPVAVTSPPLPASQPTPPPPATSVVDVAASPPAPATASATVAPEPRTPHGPTNTAPPPPIAKIEVSTPAPPTAPVTASATGAPEPRTAPAPTNQVQPPAAVVRVEPPPTPEAEAPSAPVEVVRLETEQEVKTAQDIAVPVRTAPSPTAPPSEPAPTVASPSPAPPSTITSAPAPSAARPAIDTRSSSPPPPKKKSLVQRLNPLGWIGGKDKTGEPPRMETATTPLSSPRGVARESSRPASSAVSSPPVTPSPATAPAPATPPAPAVARYNYLRPGVPAPGNRARAQDAIAQGIQAHRSGQYAQALAAYKAAVREDPSFFEAQYNLGVAAFDAGSWSEALVAFEQALALRPEDSSARLNFALSLDRANYPADAAQELELLLVRAPGSIDAHATVANLYAEKLADNDKARVHYTKVLQLNPRHPQAEAIRRWLTVHRLRP